MSVPKTNFDPPFRVIRASHGVFTAHDLPRMKEFYTEVLGLVASHEDADTLYLRGLEERSHHSLVFKRTSGKPVCERAGLRVHDDEDLDKAKHYFESKGLPAAFVEAPFQGRTLHVSDPSGVPFELVAAMDQEPRLDMEVHLHKGGAARRFDHYQITIPDVQKGAEFFTSIGFRIADYLAVGDHPVGVFLHTKNSPYDVVFFERDGPSFHHFGYIVPDLQALIRACDTAGALGYGDSVEFGPGKHSLGHSYYVYLLDPSGHRFEILLPPIIYMDGEDTPAVWDLTKINRPIECWGLPPRASWYSRRSPFPNVTVVEPPGGGAPVTLEAYLAVS